jgi:hypothetical protein
MKKMKQSLLKQQVDSYVRELNESVNAAVNKFFMQMSEIEEVTVKRNDQILPYTVTFEELIEIVQKTFSREKPFTTSANARTNRLPLIRQLTYYIGAAMGHSYNHMYVSLNSMYNKKVVKNHATVDHGVKKIEDLLSINDPKCMTLHLQIMNAVIKYVEANEKTI